MPARLSRDPIEDAPALGFKMKLGSPTRLASGAGDAQGARMSQPYLSLEAELHDAFWESEDDGSEVRLMAAFLKKHPGPALEIGAGSGRLMAPLLERGFEVEGLELSPDMRALGERRVDKSGRLAVFHAGDMMVWKAPRRYAALLVPAFTLQLAEDPAAALRHWRGWLEPEGGLYLTVFTPLAELNGDLPENEWYPDHQAVLPDGRKGLLETRHRLDEAGGWLHREHRFRIEGEEESLHESKQTIRWMEHEDWLDLLGKAGFRVRRCYPEFDPGLYGKENGQEEWSGIMTYEAVLGTAGC